MVNVVVTNESYPFAHGLASRDSSDEDDSEAAGLFPFARGSQSAVKEFGGGAIYADPIAPTDSRS
jgi:hypothetical protein